MILFDTVKIEIIPDCFIKVNKQAFRENNSHRHYSGDEITKIIVKDKLPVGINSIIAKLNKKEITQVTAKFSAKILQGDYRKLISKNTIEEAEDYFNQNMYLQIKPGTFFDMRVFRVDPVNDIQIDDPCKGIQALSLLTVNKDFRMINYKDESICFKRKTKSIIESLSFYRKGIELQRAKNKAILSFLTQSDIEYFSKIIRVEQRLNTFEQMRKSFQIPDTTLSSVLLSEAKPNHLFYQRIKGGVSSTDKILQARNLDEAKWIAFIIYCGYDINKLEASVKFFKGKNLSTARKKYLPILERLIAGRIYDAGFMEILNEIESKLSA